MRGTVTTKLASSTRLGNAGAREVVVATCTDARTGDLHGVIVPASLDGCACTLRDVGAVWIVGNAAVVVGSLVCAATLIHLRRPGDERRWPWISTVIVGLTAVVTALQHASPDLLALLRRDTDGLLAGEVWRLVTPLVVQPDGVVQICLNAFLMLWFLPVAERVYRQGLWALYLVPGVAGQAVNAWWSPDGGGSSTAVFGVMGGILAYVVRHRAHPSVPAPVVVVACVALVGGVVLTAFRDGHGVGVLVGALTSLLLHPRPVGPGGEAVHDADGAPAAASPPS